MGIEKELKTILGRQFDVETDLLDFIDGCLKEIFSEEDYKIAKWKFENDFETRDYCGCLQDLDHLKREVEEHKGHCAKAKLAHSAKKAVE